MFKHYNYEHISQLRAEQVREDQLWSPLSHRERRAWSRAIYEFKPHTSQVNTARYIHQQLHESDGVVNLEEWVSIARSADQVCLTPNDWLTICQSLYVWSAWQPGLLANNPSVEMDNRGNRLMIRPQLTCWSEWVKIRADGKSVLEATYSVLSSNNV